MAYPDLVHEYTTIVMQIVNDLELMRNSGTTVKGAGG